MVNHSSERDLGPCFDLDLSARRRRKLLAGGAVGGAWRDRRETWWLWAGASRSCGLLAEPVTAWGAQVASWRRFQGRGREAPCTCRCVKACRTRASRFGANGSEPHLGPWSDPWNHAVSLRGRRRAEPRLSQTVKTRPASDAGPGSGLSRRARCRRLARTACFLLRTRFLCWAVWHSWSAFHGRRPLTPA